MIKIDGSFGEGGGQILRTSLSLAALTGCAVQIDNIRANREKPGLRPQHLTSVMAVAKICGAEVEGASVGSDMLTFKPHAIRPGSYEFDVSKIQASAGSVNLILQTVIWPLIFAEKKSNITFKGGTHVPFAPTFNYIADIFLPTVADMGLICDYRLIKAGYYPIGGGETKLEIRPVEELKPIGLTDLTEPASVDLVSAVSNLPVSIAERQMNEALQRLITENIAPTTSILQYPSPGKGTVVFVSIRSGHVHAGFQALGELKKRAEVVADEACDEMLDYLDSGMALDKHLADQLIIPMALAKGNSKITTSEITMHLLTNITVVEKFLDVRFHISNALGEPGLIEKLEG